MPKKIMVIDDEPDIRIYLRTVLEDHDFDTCTADDSDIVEHAVNKYKPDLVLLDIMMPKRSGISIYKELRTLKEFNDIPVVLISGMASSAEFMETGFRALIKDEKIKLPDGFLESAEPPVYSSMIVALAPCSATTSTRR